MNNQSSIKVKLLSNGRYTWEINVLFDTGYRKSHEEAVKLSKTIDTQLREEFPNFPQTANSRTHEFEEE
jgi:hypothetical protein